MSLSFGKDEIARIKQPADIALALRHLHRKPSDTEVAAAADCLRRHIDEKSSRVSLDSARDFINKGKNIITENGLSIGHDASIPEYPRALKISLMPDATPAVRANLETLRHDIS